MITETVTNVLQCTTQDEFDKMMARVQAASLPPEATVLYDPVFKRITVNMTRAVEPK